MNQKSLVLTIILQRWEAWNADEITTLAYSISRSHAASVECYYVHCNQILVVLLENNKIYEAALNMFENFIQPLTFNIIHARLSKLFKRIFINRMFLTILTQKAKQQFSNEHAWPVSLSKAADIVIISTQI